MGRPADVCVLSMRRRFALSLRAVQHLVEMLLGQLVDYVARPLGAALLGVVRPQPAAPTVPTNAAQLALVAAALRRAQLAPDVAAAGFLWAAKDERRAQSLIADFGRL